MDVNCARSRSGLGVSSDSMMGVRKCWKIQVSSKLRNQKHTTHGVDKLKTPEIRSFSFVKFVDDPPSFLVIVVVMWASSSAVPCRGVESGGGSTSWWWFGQDRYRLRGTRPLFRKGLERFHAYDRLSMHHRERCSR